MLWVMSTRPVDSTQGVLLWAIPCQKLPRHATPTLPTRSYMEMSDSSNPDVLELRNRALATAASYSVGVAVK